MTERRIIKRVYNGFERYVVQYQVKLFWLIPLWFDEVCLHVGNSSKDWYDSKGYYDLVGAQACLGLYNKQNFSHEEVVK